MGREISGHSEDNEVGKCSLLSNCLQRPSYCPKNSNATHQHITKLAWMSNDKWHYCPTHYKDWIVVQHITKIELSNTFQRLGSVQSLARLGSVQHIRHIQLLPNTLTILCSCPTHQTAGNVQDIRTIALLNNTLQPQIPCSKCFDCRPTCLVLSKQAAKRKPSFFPLMCIPLVLTQLVF